MKKPKLIEAERLKDWRRLEAAEGPVGLRLLAEVLNWNPDSIDPSHYPATDTRTQILRSVIWEAKAVGFKTSWRSLLRDRQRELRKDIMDLLDGVQLTEDEFTHWLSRAGDHTRLPVDKNKSPRANRLWLLTEKIRTFHWEYCPRPGLSGMIVTRRALELPDRVRNALPDRGWSPLVGGYKSTRRIFEIGGEQLDLEEPFPRFRSVREQLYFLLYSALLTNEISRLRTCEQCKNFCVPPKGGSHCSQGCRIKSSNKSRAKDFQNLYIETRNERFDDAKAYFEKLVRGRKPSTFVSMESAINAAADKVRNDKPLVGAKKKFKNFVEEFREKELEHFA